MKLALLGDIAFFGKFDITQNKEVYNYFEDIAKLLKNYDYVIGNLETPFVTNQKEYGAKSAHIKTSPDNVELLKFLNISIVNLANNHLYDYGEQSFELTQRVLNEHNIEYFGVNGKQVKLETDHEKVALHGYCGYSTNPLGLRKKSGKGIDVLNIAEVEKNLKKNCDAGYLNIISFHIGEEHVNYPHYDHIRMARQLSHICPYVFYGHHPHVIQGIEEYNNSLIAYSLGNFCFDDVYTSKSKDPLIKQSENNKSSFILELEIIDNQIKHYKIIPFYLGEDKIILNYEGIKDQLKKYSEALQDEENVYNARRNKILSNYINERKTKRNLDWYLKRLNFRSFLLIKNAYNNRANYKKNITNYLK